MSQYLNGNISTTKCPLYCLLLLSMAKELVTLSKDLLLLQSSIEEQVTLTEDVLLLSIDKRASHSITVLLIITLLNSTRTVPELY
jgi:hypothetical protein